MAEKLPDIRDALNLVQETSEAVARIEAAYEGLAKARDLLIGTEHEYEIHDEVKRVLLLRRSVRQSYNRLRDSFAASIRDAVDDE